MGVGLTIATWDDECSDAESIGGEIGDFIEADTKDGNMAVGRFLKIKVRIDIRKPLMRGVTVIADNNGAERWCPLA